VRVTEGRASKAKRRTYGVIALTIFLCTLSLCIWLSLLRSVLLALHLALGAVIMVRYVPLSLRARREDEPGSGRGDALPSIAFIIPCLNEIESLKRTIPAMMKLEYDGTIRFFYVCESASADGSLDYIRECSQKDPRVAVIEKESAPQGRGPAVAYGLARIPEHAVVGFIDADHVMDQASLDDLARVFSVQEPPPALQGVCASANESRTWITRLLSVERAWLEATELKAGPRAGGISYYGGGQGFLRWDVARDERLEIDGSMILDDIDVSIRLAHQGGRVQLSPRVVTWSQQPESVPQFFDQRYRWCRGWLQLSGKHLFAPSPKRGVPLALRIDLLRMLLFPYAAALLYLTGTGVVSSLIVGPSRVLALLGVAWPALLGWLPYAARARRLRVGELLLSIVGIPLLWCAYSSFFAVSLVEVVLRRQPLYSKTGKSPKRRGRHGDDAK